MTKFEKIKKFPIIICFLTLFSFSSLYSRVGEEKSTLEIRLFRGGGIQYKEEQVVDRLQRGMPYIKFEEYFPTSCLVKVYFKTFDGRRPKPSEVENPRNLEGWDVHIVFYKGISMLEIYKKNEGISEFEIVHLLNLQSANSFWLKTNSKELGKESPDSSFGFDMVRDDGKVRAKRLNASTLMIFSSDFDEGLARARREDLEEKAPESINGF